MTILESLWAALDGPSSALDALEFTGPEVVLPSGFRLTEFAAAAVAVATAAVAEMAAGDGDLRPVTVDRRAACAAFRCEALQLPMGWQLPEVWDPLAGDYRSADGWVRLHTNYEHHRDAALAALGVGPDREALASAVAERTGDDVEAAVVAHGGCAAAMRSIDEWCASDAGRAVAGEQLVQWEWSEPHRVARPGVADPARPLAGIRVLDLTRVLAGPVATRFLAAYGADVLRVDPPGFAEVAAVVPETSIGKRMAMADLTDPSLLGELVRQADVVVLGTRPGASVSLDTEWLRSHNPSVVISRHDAYGWSGPWRGRRGFDSLVQMSVGIAEDQMQRTGAAKPVPLAAQALDHGTGYLIAAAVVRALTERRRHGVVSEVRTSLARTAGCLVGAGRVDHFGAPGLGGVDDLRESADTAWGPVERVKVPGRIDGITPHFERNARPVGADPLGWD